MKRTAVAGRVAAVTLLGRRPVIVTAGRRAGRGGPGGGTVTVVVEVKGCWNRHRETDLAWQLRDRYLRESGCRRGLYVVGWVVCDPWDAADRPARRAPREPVADARRRFDHLARQASVGGAVIEAFVRNAGPR